MWSDCHGTACCQSRSTSFCNADSGRVAQLRGPLLYCIEEADNPEGTDVELEMKSL
ncbi:MAG: hypothetical protein ACLUOI_30275 [Eisenbergiella sp.]